MPQGVEFHGETRIPLYLRDLTKNHLSASELEKPIGKRDKDFLNFRNEVYHQKKMSLKPSPPGERLG